MLWAGKQNGDKFNQIKRLGQTLNYSTDIEIAFYTFTNIPRKKEKN